MRCMGFTSVVGGARADTPVSLDRTAPGAETPSRGPGSNTGCGRRETPGGTTNDGERGRMAETRGEGTSEPAHRFGCPAWRYAPRRLEQRRPMPQFFPNLPLFLAPFRARLASSLALASLSLGLVALSHERVRRAGRLGGERGSVATAPGLLGAGARQFDDGIDPTPWGSSSRISPPPRTIRASGPGRWRRTWSCRARVSTVTGKVSSGNRSYQISFQTVERLAGKHPVGDDFVVQVDKESPSIGIVRTMEGELVGKTLIVFVKEFAHDGDRDLHFHASADGAETAARSQRGRRSRRGQVSHGGRDQERPGDRRASRRV